MNYWVGCLMNVLDSCLVRFVTSGFGLLEFVGVFWLLFGSGVCFVVVGFVVYCWLVAAGALLIVVLLCVCYLVLIDLLFVYLIVFVCGCFLLCVYFFCLIVL